MKFRSRLQIVFMSVCSKVVGNIIKRYFKEILWKKLEVFLCDKRPDLFDYIASRDIAQKDNCVICLQWIVPYSGTYSEVIYGNESDEDLEAMDKKHYVYPV